MTMWEAFDALGDLVDQSDPDTSLPNDRHAFQTAEGIRAAGKPPWMQLVGLIHDLGKVQYLKGCDGDHTSIRVQHGVVGDTFIVGHPLSNALIYPEFNSQVADFSDRYEKGCGFDACVFSFGHDEYLYQVLKHNERAGRLNFSDVRIRDQLLYVIRYHSFHAWHEHEAYSELANENDINMLPTLREFTAFDLYTKSDDADSITDEKTLRAYYTTLFQTLMGCDPMHTFLEW